MKFLKTKKKAKPLSLLYSDDDDDDDYYYYYYYINILLLSLLLLLLLFIYFFFFFFFFEFIDLNKQAVIYKAKALKQIQINSKGQP